MMTGPCTPTWEISTTESEDPQDIRKAVMDVCSHDNDSDDEISRCLASSPSVIVLVMARRRGPENVYVRDGQVPHEVQVGMKGRKIISLTHPISRPRDNEGRGKV